MSVSLEWYCNTIWYSSPLYWDMFSSDMAWQSQSDEGGSGKCGADIVCDNPSYESLLGYSFGHFQLINIALTYIALTWSDNSSCDKHGSDKCIMTWSDNPGCNNVTDNCDSEIDCGSDMALTRFKQWNWQVPAQDTRHSGCNQLIQAIKNIILYDSEDTYWLRRYWFSSLLGTSCMGVRTAESSIIHLTLCGTSCHIFIPWVLAGIADDIYTKSSTASRLRCTVSNVNPQSPSSFPVLILSLKWSAYSTLGG